MITEKSEMYYFYTHVKKGVTMIRFRVIFLLLVLVLVETFLRLELIAGVVHWDLGSSPCLF